MSRSQRTVALRLDLDAPAVDLHVVSLARPHQRAVRTERDRLVVVVLRLVGDADALHGVDGSGMMTTSSPRSLARRADSTIA